MMPFAKKHTKPIASSLDSGCFSPDNVTSDDESSTNEWEVTGAFPRLTSSSSAATGKNHIFTDEPFDSDFDCLEVVPEGSTCSEDQPQDNSVMVISTTGSETQPLDNRGEVAALRHLGPLGPKFGLPDFLLYASCYRDVKRFCGRSITIHTNANTTQLPSTRLYNW